MLIKNNDGCRVYFVLIACDTRTTAVITNACIVMLQILTTPPARNWFNMAIDHLSGILIRREPGLKSNEIDERR